MIRTLIAGAASAVLLAGFSDPSVAAAQAMAGAPTQPGPTVGARVEDRGGANLGRIESVLTDGAGRPLQVVVRTPGIAGARTQLKTLPVSSLRANGDGYRIGLRRAEFDALPSLSRR